MSNDTTVTVKDLSLSIGAAVLIVYFAVAAAVGLSWPAWIWLL